MKIIQKKLLFFQKHYDFLIVDILAFALGYWLSLLFRRSLNVLHNEDKLLLFGIVAVASFFVVEIVTEKLAGVISRGIAKETQITVVQMVQTWMLYFLVLFMTHDIFALSRIMTLVSFLLCTFFVLLLRSVWKLVCKSGKISMSVMPELLIVCEATRAQNVLNRMIFGVYSRNYDICGLVLNENGKADYQDVFPCDSGLQNLGKYLGERRVQDAYIELDDEEEERQVIGELLDAGIVVHRSLGNSVLTYANQSLDQLNGKSVITISGRRVSLASKVDEKVQQFRQRISSATER